MKCLQNSPGAFELLVLAISRARRNPGPKSVARVCSLSSEPAGYLLVRERNSFLGLNTADTADTRKCGSREIDVAEYTSALLMCKRNVSILTIPYLFFYLYDTKIPRCLPERSLIKRLSNFPSSLMPSRSRTWQERLRISLSSRLVCNRYNSHDRRFSH